MHLYELYQFKVTFTLRVNITRIPLWKMHHVQLSISVLLLIQLYRNFYKNSTALSLPDVLSMYIACTDQLCTQQSKNIKLKSNTKLKSL